MATLLCLALSLYFFLLPFTCLGIHVGRAVYFHRSILGHNSYKSFSYSLMDDFEGHSEADRDYTQIFRDLQDSERQADLKNKALNLLLSKFKLTTTPATSARDSSNLCSSCGSIDFETIFFNKTIWSSLQKELGVLELPPPSAIPVHVPRKLDATMLESSCPLCKILTTMVYGPDVRRRLEKHGPPIWHLRAVACLPGGQIALFLTEHWEASRFSYSNWEINMKEGWLLPHIVNSSRTASLGEHYCTCGIPLTEDVHYSWMKRRLTDCETLHGQDCSGVLPKYSIKARVIDCVERMVVTLNQDMKYIALSYVWGPQKPRSFTADEKQNNGNSQWKLPEHLPQSIEDSMEVTKCLGLRYLWVDRYCIRQVHATDKKFQISQMGKIYGQAYATICALGPHDDYGLYGVSKPRTRNHFTDRNTMTTIIRATRPARIKSYIEGSSWSKRGWTYQEALLSRRCLFFTPEGNFMVCKKECTSEGIILPLDDDASREVKIAPDGLFWRPRGHKAGIFPFQALVNEYQKRTLRYDSDRLSALEGLLSTQELSTVIGVPIMKIPQPETDTALWIRIGFVKGLAWRCYNSFVEVNNSCAAFPSWSWLSRKRSTIQFQDAGSISSIWPNVFVGPTLFIPYFADVFVQTTETTLQTIENFLAPFMNTNQDKAINEDLRYLHIKSLVARWRQIEILNNQGTSGDIEVYFKISHKDELPYWMDYQDNSSEEQHKENSERSFPKEELNIRGMLSSDDSEGSHSTEGIAILMFASIREKDLPCDELPKKYARRRKRMENSVEMFWLAIHETGDGCYGRDGIIKTYGSMCSSAHDRAARSCIEAPPHLETIKLG
jgi:hypothetical protein